MTPSGASDRCRRARHPRLAQGATPQRATRQAAPSRPGLDAASAWRIASSSIRSSGEQNGTYCVIAPRDLAYSRMPLIEL